MLIEIIERRSPTTNRKSIVYILDCDFCKSRIEASACRIKRYPNRHFCNRQCMGSHKRQFPETWPNNSASRITPEACKKATETKRRRWASGELKHSWLGRKHSEETKKHLSEVCSNGFRAGKNNGMFGRRHSDDAKAKMSESKSMLILDGKFRPYGSNKKTGWYESSKTGRKHWFRSSWEETVMNYLDKDPNVVTWNYESVRIQYYYNNNKRWHIPDFVVTFMNNTTEMWEVKPSQFLQTERVCRTSEAGKKYCAENNISLYKFITGNEIHELQEKIG